MADLPMWPIVLVTFALGAAVGSFANVVIYRVPMRLSLVAPGSMCPTCGEPIKPWDNVPILSYFILSGRCRHCRTPISLRYPVVESTVALLWIATTIKLGLHLVLPAYLVFGTVIVILSAIDLEHRRLPNAIIGPAFAAAVALFTLAAAASGQWSHLLSALLGALAYSLPMMAIAIMVPRGMGMGDVKLSAYLGLHLGWLSLGHVAVGAFLGFLIGSVIGIGLVAAGRKGRKDTIPFGPSMAGGALLAVFVARSLLGLWLRGA